MSITVEAIAGSSYMISIGDHRIVTDQPIDEGGGDTGPTPLDMFVAGLAACVAFYAGRFLQRHQPGSPGIRVNCAYTMADDEPRRVGAVTLDIQFPPAVAEPIRDAALRAARHCTVHNTLRNAPAVDLQASTAVPE